MTVEREYPHGRRGSIWPGNGEAYETNRRRCLETAELMRAEGNLAGAERFESHAATYKAQRDEELRRDDMKRMNRRAHRGLF